MSGSPTRVGWTCLTVGAVVAAWAMLAISARATYNARTTADEPQYLLSALSLAEDRDLWIDDELADHRYEPFHEVLLPVQTEPRDDGRTVSPHDPLLPVVLAVPVGLGGWVAAKATLALLGGALAALLTWTAQRRFGVSPRVAAGTVLAFGLAAPLAPYATQVYPELPAALAVTVVVAAIAGPLVPVPSKARRGPAWIVAAWLAIVSLPWLGVKYAPVAAALALVCLVRLWQASRTRSAVAMVIGFAVAGVAYLVGHRLIYGGWTVYAAGDHFVSGGELSVVGHEPNYLGRSQRLVGLLLDRSFGLAAWMPGYLLAVPALVTLARRRPPGSTLVLVAPLVAGWATATWVALTMHGWWWPGRQTVVVLPCLVLAMAWWIDQQHAVVRRTRMLAAAAAFGVVSWLWLLVEVWGRHRTLIVDFDTTTNPLYRVWQVLLPDYRGPGAGDWLRHAAWLVLLGFVALRAWRSASSPLAPAASTSSAFSVPEMRRRPTHVPA
jgi:hypothetical protein